MSEPHDEQQAQRDEQARVDELAHQNEQVRRAEHPEEFTDTAGGDGERNAAPVAPASVTGAEPAVPVGDDAERYADDLTTLGKLEQGARELRRKLFGETTS